MRKPEKGFASWDVAVSVFAAKRNAMDYLTLKSARVSVVVRCTCSATMNQLRHQPLIRPLLSALQAPTVQEPRKNVKPFRKCFMHHGLVFDPYLKIVGVPLKAAVGKCKI